MSSICLALIYVVILFLLFLDYRITKIERAQKEAKDGE